LRRPCRADRRPLPEEASGVVAGVVVAGVADGASVTGGVNVVPGPGVMAMPVAGAASVTGIEYVDAAGVSPCETTSEGT
jgi:hypothetical protein